jgi:hypothetical protein
VQQQQRNSTLKSVIEALSIIGPIICLVDCIVIPLALAILPFMGMQNVVHGVSDQFLALIVLSICAPVLGSGYFQHRKKSVLLFMAAGFSLIFFANFAGHNVDAGVHTMLSLLGSSFLVKANLDNKRFSKGCPCHDHHHD